MTVIRHAYLLLAIVAAATALNWAAEQQWRNTVVSVVLFTAAYLLSERLARK